MPRLTMGLFFFILSGDVLFAVLWTLTVLHARATRSSELRAADRVLSLVYAAFLFGETYGLLLQAVQLGWLRPGLVTFLLTVWPFVQVLGFMTLGLLIFVGARRVHNNMGGAGLVFEILTGRILADISIDTLNLTPREREVVDVVAAGQLSDREIAGSLYISPATAATHVRNILRKAGLHRRTDLLLLASRESFRA